METQQSRRTPCLPLPTCLTPTLLYRAFLRATLHQRAACNLGGGKKKNTWLLPSSFSALNSLSWLFSHILLDAACYFTRLQERIEERIAKYTSETEGWLESDALMLRLRELCDAAVAEHGAVKYDELMGTLNEEFGPATVQERQEPIKKVVTAYPGHSIVRSQNL